MQIEPNLNGVYGALINIIILVESAADGQVPGQKEQEGY